MANRDVLAIGTSAGGVEALIFLAERFPREFPAAVLVTIHLPSNAGSALDQVLSRAGPLPAQFARNGDRVRKGRIYIAPPDRHLLLDGDHVGLGEGPRENNSRPAIDPMLRSTAVCCSGRASPTGWCTRLCSSAGMSANLTTWSGLARFTAVSGISEKAASFGSCTTAIPPP